MVLEHADWEAAKPSEIIDRLISLSQTKTGPDDPGLEKITQLVWPESSLPKKPAS